jgi:flagellar basal body-associated protein FliL
MDPSKEKNQKQTSPSKRKSKIIPIILIVLLLAASCGAAFYYYNSSKKTRLNNVETDSPVIQENALADESTANKDQIVDNPSTSIGEEATGVFDDGIETTDIKTDTQIKTHDDKNLETLTSKQTEASNEIKPLPTLDEKEPVKVSICNEPVKQLDTFYKLLDKKAYMSAYAIDESSKNHFSKLITKLLANPPQVTRESDDLYTILKNTAHFFRISGKDNILMMKGILDNEKDNLEQILSDYYLLVSNTECSTSSYGDVDKDALYEYACFFLNTMGGRLYLFRRDSLSRMVVTYYAILLVDEANIQNNNRYGIALRPVVDMLVSEMEMSGSSLKKSEIYLDKLYDLKEKYQ